MADVPPVTQPDEGERISFADLPDTSAMSLNDLEAFVDGKPTTPGVQDYLGQAHRVVNLSGAFAADQPGSAGAGFISLNPMTKQQVERAVKVAREAGWTGAEGWPDGS